MKMIIDIPDNELKDPLKNIHLLISKGNVTEVCIKKYDKDKPYFMNLNYAPLEECEDTISRQAAINVVICDVLSSAIVYGRTEEGMSARKAIVDGLKRLPPVTPAEKVGQWIPTQRDKYIDINCSKCGYTRIKEYAYNYTVDEIDMQEIKDLVVTSKMNYCECCGAKMQGVEE